MIKDKVLESYISDITHIYWDEYTSVEIPIIYTYLNLDEIDCILERLDKVNLKYFYVTHATHVEVGIKMEDIINHKSERRNDIIDKILNIE